MEPESRSPSYNDEDLQQEGWWSKSSPTATPTATPTKKSRSTPPTAPAKKAAPAKKTAPAPPSPKNAVYEIHFEVDTRRYSGSKNSISAQIVGETESTAFTSVGSFPKEGQVEEMQRTLRDVGEPTRLKLKSSGTDGLRLSMVKVRKNKGSWHLYKTAALTVMCRGRGSKRSCTMELQEAKETPEGGGGSSTPCVEGLKPPPLTSDFKQPKDSIEAKYTGFTVYVDCCATCWHRGTYRFEYFAHADCGNFPRHGGFKRDPDYTRAPKRCQQTNGKSYPKHKNSKGVKVASDRGHMVPANHLDSNKQAIAESNYMTNIMPQAANMNRGAWLQTEELVECYRDVQSLHVVGGSIWASNYNRLNWFVDSHNVKNPSFFWKVITSRTLFPQDNHRIAWIIPNSEDAKRNQLDKYLVSISELERRLGEAGQPQEFDIPIDQKSYKATKSWAKPAGCDLSL